MRRLDDAEQLLKLVSHFNDARKVEFLVNSRIFPEANRYEPTGKKVETLLKKLAIYADKVIFLLPDVAAGNAQESQNMVIRLEELASAHISSTEFQEIFYFLPEKVVPRIEAVSDFFDDGGASGDMLIGDPAFDFEVTYHNEYGYYIDLSDFQIQSHVFELSECNAEAPSVLNVWLPCIENIPLEVFLQIRNDEHDAFVRLQHAVKKILRETNGIDSTTKVKELFETVDYETRAYEARMQKVKRSRALRKYEMLIGACVMGVGLALDSHVMKIIMSVIGSYSLKGVIDNAFRDRERIDDLSQSDFHIPWMLNKENLRNI